MSEHNPTDFGSRLVERGLLPRGSVIAGDRWKTAVAFGEADAAPVAPPPAVHPAPRPPSKRAAPAATSSRSCPSRGAAAEGPEGPMPVVPNPVRAVPNPVRARHPLGTTSPVSRHPPGEQRGCSSRTAPTSRSQPRLENHSGYSKMPRPTTVLHQRVTVNHVKSEPKVFLELYAGCCRLTGACLDLGVGGCWPMEITLGPEGDLHNRKIQRLLLRWARQGRFGCVWFGTPCTFWSVATGRARAKHETGGLTAARFTIRMLRAPEQASTPWVIENPNSSGLWGGLL